MPNHTAFPALDGLRALAVAMVVGTHAAFWTGKYVNSDFKAPLARLDAGVAVFFVLSGFLLVRPWLIGARDRSPAPYVRVYFWRRALRILPLYWITVVLAFLLLVQRPPLTAADWWHHAFLLQIYHFGWLRGGLTQTWSLCTEVSFYLVLPLIGMALTAYSRRFGWRPGHLLVATAVLAAVSVVWPFAIYRTGFGLAYTANLWLPAYLSWFAGGIALAIVEVHVAGGGVSDRWTRRLHTARTMPGVWLAGALAVFAIACTPVAGPLGLATSAESTTAAVRSTLYAVCAVLVLFPAVFCPEGRFYRFLATPFMRRMGEVSYGVFLLHLLILQGLMNVFGWHTFTGNVLYLFLATIVLATLAAMLSFRFIEEPAMRLRRLVRGPGGRISAARELAESPAQGVAGLQRADRQPADAARADGEPAGDEPEATRRAVDAPAADDRPAGDEPAHTGPSAGEPADGTPGSAGHQSR